MSLPGFGEHLELEEIRELMEGQAISTEWVERMLHLWSCEECRQEMRELFPTQAPRLLERLFPWMRSASPNLDAPASSSWKRWESLREEDLRNALTRQLALAREEDQAVELWRRFRDHDEAQWSLLVANHPAVQTFGMVRLLLRRAKASWRSSPRRAEKLTRTALGILDRLPWERYDRLQLEQTHALALGVSRQRPEGPEKIARSPGGPRSGEGIASSSVLPPGGGMAPTV